jgi:hypothetical protein
MELLRGISGLFAADARNAFIALLAVTCLTLFGLLMRAHRQQMALLERVATLTERLAPVLLKLAATKPRRRTGTTGAHPVVEESP